MISIDTQNMRQLVSVCSAANESIIDAVEVLNRVTSHNDWGCKERVRINEYTTTNKRKIGELQEKSGNFLKVLTSVSHEFENAEDSISDMFSTLEALLGGVIGIPSIIHDPLHTGRHTGGGFSDEAGSIFGDVAERIRTNNTGHAGVGFPGGLGDILAETTKILLPADLVVCAFDDVRFDGGEI